MEVSPASATRHQGVPGPRAAARASAQAGGRAGFVFSILALLAVLPLWYFFGRTGFDRPSDRSDRIAVREEGLSDFDRTLDLPSRPQNLAWGDSELLAVNHNQPWGFLRLIPRGSAFDLETVEVIEPTYNQRRLAVISRLG